MEVIVRLCDICRAEAAIHWPLHVSADHASSPTGQHLSVDFCSVACLQQYVAALPEPVDADHRE